jgi:hypothetical protein
MTEITTRSSIKVKPAWTVPRIRYPDMAHLPTLDAVLVQRLSDHEKESK